VEATTPPTRSSNGTVTVERVHLEMATPFDALTWVDTSVAAIHPGSMEQTA
jgi:hypothetical protein